MADVEARPSWVRRHAWTTLLVTSWLALYLVEANSPGYNAISGQGTLPPLLTSGVIEPTRVAAGEWWRILTAAFFHFGLLHLGLNSAAMLVVGNYVEPRLGSLRMLVVYVGAILASSVGAYVTTNGEHTVTAGASGAIIGLFGAMALMAYPLVQEENALQQAIVPILLTIFSGFTHSGISNGGHIGGLLGGIAVALVIVRLSPSAWMIQTRERQEAVALRTASENPRREPRIVDASSFEGVSITLRPRGITRVAIVGGGLALVAAGIWALLAPLGIGGGIAGETDIPLFAGGWVGLALGLMLLLGVGPMHLELSPVGFKVQTLLRQSAVAWADVAGFGTMRISTGYGSQTQVAYTFIGGKAYGRRGWFGSYPDARTKVLPAVFGMKAEAQAALMEEWRQRWAPADLASPATLTPSKSPIRPLTILAASAALFVVVGTIASASDRRVHANAQTLIIGAADIGTSSIAHDGALGTNGWARDLLLPSTSSATSGAARATVWVTVFATTTDAQTDLRRIGCDQRYKWSGASPIVSTMGSPQIGDADRACQYVFNATDHQFAFWTTDRNVRIDVLIAQSGSTDNFAIATGHRVALTQIARIDRLAPR